MEYTANHLVSLGGVNYNKGQKVVYDNADYLNELVEKKILTLVEVKEDKPKKDKTEKAETSKKVYKSEDPNTGKVVEQKSSVNLK